MDEALHSNERRLIVGLGNPGREYALTRHNVGFNVVDYIASKHGLKFNKMMNKALVAMGDIQGSKVILLKPQTYMNDSGIAVGPTLKYYKISPLNLMVVYDELDLPLAQLRMRKMGGSGGHNGMKSLISHIGTDSFPRLRVGIGRPPGRMEPVDYVLQTFSKSDGELMDALYRRATEAVERWLKEDIERVMNFVNVTTIDQ